MERAGEEVVANDTVGNAEFVGKGCDAPNMLGSPVMCSSVSHDWPESSSCGDMDRRIAEDNDLSRCLECPLGSEPSRPIPRAMNDNGNMIDELTARNYRNRTPHVASVRSRDNNRRSKWQCMYQLPCGSKFEAADCDYVSKDDDKILLRAGAQLMKTQSDLQNLKPWLTKRIEHDTGKRSASLKASDKRIKSGYTLPNGDSTLKTLSMPSVSQPLVKKTLKGKEVAYRNREDVTESCGAVVNHIDENLGYVRKVATDALVRSSANSDQLSLGRIDRSGPQSLHLGISLTEWMKQEGRRRDKAESLLIFRQIVELVDSAHSEGAAFQDLRPSCFNILPSNMIMYTGSSGKSELEAVISHDLVKKRLLEEDMGSHSSSVAKQQKLSENMKFQRHQSQFNSSCGLRSRAVHEIDICTTGPPSSGYVERQSQKHSSYQSSCMKTRQQSISSAIKLEEKWYRSPEELNVGHSTFSSNIYSLGVLLFELLSWFESFEVHSAAMLDLHNRILPPTFLSENPWEAGFCLWLLHPKPSCRPTAREILQSELICQSLHSGSNVATSPDNDDTESGLLLHFLNLLKEQKQKHASKLVEDIECLEEDIKEIEVRNLSRTSSTSSQSKEKYPDVRTQSLHLGVTEDVIPKTFLVSNMNEQMLMRNINQIEEAYFSMRSQILLSSSSCSDKNFLKNPDSLSAVHNKNKESNINQRSVDPLGEFFEGLCKFARYHSFEVRGSVKNGDFVSSTNVVCSLSFDRDEEYIAAAGASKKIKIFEFGALLNDSMDVYYPIVEMSNKSKLSCVCWNNYIKNYLASTDYDGIVQIWDAGTAQRFSQYSEHQKRAWSVDFSPADPLMFASGSDDWSVKLWSTNERNSIGTIWNPANVCCVQFSSSSTHLLVLGSADYQVYCYDLRHTRIPWCTLAGHNKAVSYVKFLDSETIISSSTDNTLKLWDLNKTSSIGFSSSACSLTFSGHTNEKNFVGLSAMDGYLACGSETNEVYCYYRSLPMPITCHKFGYIDPISGIENGDDTREFVSSVCWRQRSNMLVAANSSGNMKVLQMV